MQFTFHCIVYLTLLRIGNKPTVILIARSGEVCWLKFSSFRIIFITPLYKVLAVKWCKSTFILCPKCKFNRLSKRALHTLL